ncbi:MAG: TrkA family potassium uptake protein [Clostridia bacterium]|nr:TrkA family potassium uptake protein [Clostridia bacterium]
MKSVLVIGMGRFGKHLAEKMQQLGNDVMIVDRNASKIEELASKFTDSYIGDCTNEGTMRALGVNNFDVCFVCIGENFQSSLEITALLNDLGAKYIVAKGNRDIQARFLKSAGAAEVVYPEREIAENLAIRFNSDNIYDCIELTADYSIFEIPVLESWVGKSIMAVNVRRDYHINIIAIKKDEVLNPVPGGDYVFAADDHLVVIGKASDIFRLSSKVKDKKRK